MERNFLSLSEKKKSSSMPFYKTIKTFLLCFFGFNIVFSQNFPSRNYTSANELPNNAVRSLLIDSNNFLWIGTENGVVKKENDVFKYYFEEDGLALNSCWAIAEDENRKLWFGSYGEGVSIYDGFKFEVISEEEGLVHNEITKLFSHGEQMYVGTSDGVSIIDINSFQVLSLKTPLEKELFRVQDFFEYRKQIYVVTYNSGIFKIEEEIGKPGLKKVNDHKFIYSVFVDNDSIYSSNKGFFNKSTLADYLDDNGPSSGKKSGSSIIWDYVKGNEQKIFTAAWGIFDNTGGIFELAGNKMVSRASEFNIPSTEIIALAYDPQFERLYAGTKDAGLFEVSLHPQIKFHKIEAEEILGFAKTDSIHALLLNDGIILRGAGIEHSISLHRFKKWQEHYVLNTKLPLPEHKNDFYELNYSAVAENIEFYDIKASGGVFWVNTSIGIFGIEGSGELQRYLPLHSEEINFTPAGELIETNPYGGVRVYNDLDSFEYTHYNKEDPQIPTMVVNSLQRGDKTYFLSIFSGLYVWENNGFRSYLGDGIWAAKKLKHITPLGDNLAISNEFGDVFIVNDEETFTILEKIPRSRIRGNSIGFLRQFNNFLIIGTEKGLNLYKAGRHIFLDKEQGLEQPFWKAAVDENILFIGSENGYYTLDLKTITETEAQVDQLKVQGVFINNNKTSLKPFDPREQIKLAYNENTILIKFGTNAHPYPNKLRYQYRLNSNENWSLPSSESEVFLPFLPTGNYAVDIKVLDESTGLSYSQPLLKLAILPPFWKTWWFLLLVAAIIFLGVYVLYRIQIKQTREFEEQRRLIQKRFEETKMEALLAQMNPHFIFNAMNSIQYYIMESDIDNATIFLGDFAKLIRLNLDHCTRQSIMLADEIEYLHSYIRVENTRFNNAIKVIFEIDPQIDTYDVQIPTMILQTFVENVFVHAFPASISNPTMKVSFKLVLEGVLECGIEDNGIGFSEGSTNRLHESKGVSLVKERLALLGYDVEEALEIISSRNKGTSITLRLRS